MAPIKHARPHSHCSHQSTSSAATNGSSRGGRRHKKDQEDFRNYLFKILKEIYSDTGITKQAMDSLNSLINYLFEVIATEASSVMMESNRTILTANDIQTAIRRILPGELQKHAVSEGTKAIVKFKSFYK